MKRLTAIAAILLFVSASALADIARPEPAKTPKAKTGKSVVTTMDIRLEADAKEARLIIPKSQVKQLRAQLDEMDSAEDDTAAVTEPRGVGRTQTAMTGLFLSLALIFGGMWFVRSGKAATKTVKTLVIATVVAGIGSAATLVYANIAPPPIGTRTITGKMFSESMRRSGFGFGQIKLETSATEDRIKLIVPDPGETPASE